MHGVQVRSLVRELRSHMSCIQSLDQSIKLISIRKCWECVAALAVPPTTRAPRRLHVPSLARGGDGLGDVSLPASQWHITVSELSSSAPRILREKDLLYDLLSGRLLSVSLRWASLQLRESACLLRKKNGLLGTTSGLSWLSVSALPCLERLGLQFQSSDILFMCRSIN